MNRGLVPHTLVASPSTNTDALGLASTRTDTVPVGGAPGGFAVATAAGPAHGSVRSVPTLSANRCEPHTQRAIEAATTSNVCGTATRERLVPQAARVAADSNARAHQLAKDTSSSHDDTGARETRRQRDATQA